METHIIYIGVVFVLAGVVKGVTGMGLPTVAMALLSLFVPPLEAAALLIVPSLLTNVWQLASGEPVFPLWQRFWPMLVAICLGTLAGSAMFAVVGSAPAGDAGSLGVSWSANATLGVALAIYGILGLLAIRFTVPEGAEPWLSPVIGALTGLLTAASGVFTLPAVPYLQALGLKRDELVQAMGLSFTVSTAALAVTLAMHDALHPAVAGASLLAQFPAMAGMYLGTWLRRRMNPVLFRRCFFGTLIALGGHLALA
ncbi:sulfite exporter TauE/SafE family protein [Pseudoduganella sp. RAF19]|uniref:sulfite exporter TauE/SafE family protein n=2 Tax=unclassified Pseudoduganella TaxID=2637179 RepID=UPI003F963797